jgi:hypothetical protein
MMPCRSQQLVVNTDFVGALLTTSDAVSKAMPSLTWAGLKSSARFG